MSTSCIIAAKNNPSIGVYLHWDGGDMDMIKKIVNKAKEHRVRNPNSDESYGMFGIARAIAELDKCISWETGYGLTTFVKGKPKYYCNFIYYIDEDWNIEQVIA